MPLDLGAARPRAWSEPGRTTLELSTGAWRSRRPRYVEAAAPCHGACPAGEAIPGWIQHARAGDHAAAWRLLREDNPFPAITGRVCGHPCESVCNRRAHDGAVAINALERVVGDWGLEHGQARPVPVTRRERVAIVGAGPAGLACAYHLARLGYGTTLFEREPAPGGLLRYGIPEYRLPRAVLEREIALVLALGVRVEVGCTLGRTLAWRDVETYDAVFVATGAGVPVRLGVPGEAAAGIEDGLRFLRALADGGVPPVGRRVVVVGGGSTAMDVARSARRLGARAVTVVALETRAAMPALAAEIAQALAEGVEIVNGLGVTQFVELGGRVSGVVVAGARLERDGDGAVRPRFDAGARRVIGVDQVLLAIGQRADLAPLASRLGARAPLVPVDPDGATQVPNLFAGGDVASASRTVAHAIGAGTRAARAIHARLTGTARPAVGRPGWTEAWPDHTVRPAEIGLHHFAALARATREERLPATRVQSFVEVVQPLPEPAARTEAARCFGCGTCTQCDVCLSVCPDMAIARLPGGGYRVALEHCKGCGLCAAECPRGALAMVAER